MPKDNRTVKRRVEKKARSHVPFRFASQKNKSHARFHGSVFRISFASEVATNSWQRDSPRLRQGIREGKEEEEEEEE